MIELLAVTVQNIVLEPGDEESEDHGLFKFSKLRGGPESVGWSHIMKLKHYTYPHSATGMLSRTPSEERMGCFLIFRAPRRVSSGVPDFWIGIDFRVHVNEGTVVELCTNPIVVRNEQID